ncbi:hypothetical protein BSK94_07635 [Campylobacter coli]|nr:hypothetical protein [Campylobacter coli]
MVSAYPKPIKIFKNTAIKVSNFPFDPNLKIKIYSLNSYVGGKIKCRKRKIKCRIFATNYLSFNLKLKL